MLKFSHSEISDYAEHGNIQVGDLMYFSDGIDTLPYHSTIVSKVDEKNIYYAAHTNERKDYALSNVDKNTWFFVVRIFDNAS